jgi:hypothetical protein
MQPSVFLPLCRQRIVWQPLTGRDPYGAPIYGAPTTFPGRRSYKYSRVASYERGTKGQGAEVISESQIWILSIPFAPQVKYEDRIFVEGDDLTRLPPILSIQQPADETGQIMHTKCYLGSSNG